MAALISSQARHTDQWAYPLIRRAQAKIALYRHFNGGDLSGFLERESFGIMADRLARRYFHRSEKLVIFSHVVELYTALLVMAPVLQRIPLSCKFDWHHGHLLGWFRVNTSSRIGRYHFSCRIIPREYQPDLLNTSLNALGIHDSGMVAVIQDLYRRHAGGTTLRDLLAHQLLDPLVLASAKQGYELRYANTLFRLEKQPFIGSVDLRYQTAQVLWFTVISGEHRGGRHLEINIAQEVLTGFRENITQILALPATPSYKINLIENRIHDLVERTRLARSALPQIQELQSWMSQKIKPLAGTIAEANSLPHVLLNQWLQRSDHRLYLKSPNFFLDAGDVPESTYHKFFTPYREVTL